MKLRYFGLGAYLMALVSCASAPQTHWYGTRFDTTAALSTDELLSTWPDSIGHPLVVKGTVAEICLAEGCWLTLRTPDGDPIFVDWDHAFSVPYDNKGKQVYIKGRVYVDSTHLETLRREAKKAGKSDSAIAHMVKLKLRPSLKASGVYFSSLPAQDGN